MSEIDAGIVEAVARALCGSEGHKDQDALICPAHDHANPRPRWMFYVDDACAAIAAYEEAKSASDAERIRAEIRQGARGPHKGAFTL